jgi:hypothetical protein
MNTFSLLSVGSFVLGKGEAETGQFPVLQYFGTLS